MSVAEKLARQIDLIQMTFQSMSELSSAIEREDAEKITQRLECLEEMAAAYDKFYAAFSDLFKGLRNRRYDMGIESLIERIQSKES